MMLRFATLFLLLSTAAATPEELPIDQRSAQFVNKSMTLAMLCEKAIGKAHYQAARATGVALLTRYMGKSEAHAAVKELENRLKNDGRMLKLQDDADPEKCLEMINDLHFEYGDLL